jgi:hypothetical protein
LVVRSYHRHYSLIYNRALASAQGKISLPKHLACDSEATQNVQLAGDHSHKVFAKFFFSHFALHRKKRFACCLIVLNCRAVKLAPSEDIANRTTKKPKHKSEESQNDN